MKTNRYPGVKPFEIADQDRFFGRDRDTRDLYDLILLEKLVVLFGKSGYGKSSLLYAGIIPRLLAEADEEVRYQPLLVRLGAYVEGQTPLPLENLLQRLAERFPSASGAAFLDDLLSGPSLWKAFKQRQAAGGPHRFVLIFDQFEEFFSYPPEACRLFKEQLAALLHQDAPQEVCEDATGLPRADRLLLATPLNIKAVFAIREDRLSLLDSLKDFLPAILHKRYELRALSREQAREAIVNPAALEGTQYLSAPFRYDPAALEVMLDELSRSQGAQAQQIEAFLLQILCQYLEAGVIDRGKRQVVIRPEDLPQMTNLVEGYYHQRIGRLPVSLQAPARRLIEALVLTDPASGESRRVALDGDLLLAQYRNRGATPELLRELENTFLLRREANTLGGFNYEVSHDTLIDPIRKAQQARREAEIRRARRRLAGLVALALTVALAAVLFALWALEQRNIARNALQNMKAAEQAKAITEFEIRLGKMGQVLHGGNCPDASQLLDLDTMRIKYENNTELQQKIREVEKVLYPLCLESQDQ